MTNASRDSLSETERPVGWGSRLGSIKLVRPNQYSDPGAGDRNRTRNLLFTKQLLCQLSYAGVKTNCARSGLRAAQPTAKVQPR
jgi:hypothetical protein